jgi:peptide deformylase
VKRKLLFYGNDLLAQKSSDVTEFGAELRSLVEDMFETLDAEKGIGLAAPQIGVLSRVIVIDLSPFDDGPRVALVNPEIYWYSKDTVTYDEGCLSVPGVFYDVIRPEKIKVRAKDIDGKPLDFEADEVFSRVIQHETDHLDGVLFIERIPEEHLKEISSDLEKIRKSKNKKK